MSAKSYQDLDTRLRGVEEMVLFLMGTMRMRAQIATGIVGADGKPTFNTVEGSMFDFYREAKARGLQIVRQNEQASPFTGDAPAMPAPISAEN